MQVEPNIYDEGVKLSPPYFTGLSQKLSEDLTENEIAPRMDNIFSKFAKVRTMEIDKQEREQAILDTAATFLLRHGYNKLTMSDVADAVGLNRKLVYLLFPSKDALIQALLLRELNRYADVWNRYLESDPLGGTVASVYRGLLAALKQFPLMAAMYTRDEQTFGKYLSRPGNFFASWPPDAGPTREYLQAMQEIGVVRQDTNTRAMAFILDALTTSILAALSSHTKT